MKKMILCGNCIEAIRSRGEKLFVGDEIDYDEIAGAKCEWCDDDDEFTELFEVMFE